MKYRKHWHGAWHISSIAAAAAAITISFTITGKYQQKNGPRMHTGYSQVILRSRDFFKNSPSLLTEIQIKPIIILHLPNKDKHFKLK